MRGRTSTSEIDAVLRQIARPQLGLVTVAQASWHGVDRSALARRRKAGALAGVFPGVMRLTAVEPSAAQTILAAGLAVSGSAIAAASAAIVGEWPVGSTSGLPILSVSATTSARTPGIVAIRHTFRLPAQWWHGARLATPAATLLLLPRFVGARTIERCLDHTLTHRLTTVAVVQDLLHSLPSRAIVGRRLLRELLAQRAAGRRHRSDLEQELGRWLTSAGLRGWMANYPVPVGVGSSVEVDFAWPHAKVALEVSPFYTHGSRAAQERDAERRRSLAAHGWHIVEATDPDLESSRAFAPTVACLVDLLSSPTRAPRGSERHTPLNLHREAG